MWIGFVATMAASLALTPVARHLAVRWGAVDAPDGKRKLQKKPVPLWGGVAVYLSMLLGLVLLNFGPTSGTADLQGLSLVLALAAGIVCLCGCFDDSWDLNARFKLLLQIVAVLPAVIAGYTVDRVVMFGHPFELGWLGIPLTVFWLVGCINALNLLDGMDGLASAVGLSTAGMLAIIAMAQGHDHVAAIAVVLAGALAGFLLYNLPPASIYLGDSGSMVIGMTVGLLSIQGSIKTTATLSITAPAIVMAIPMIDTILAIIRRKLSGMRFDVADRGHIHHRLLDRGLTTWQALCVISALCLVTGASATAATLLRNDALAWIVTICVFVLMVRLRAFGHHELALVKLKIASLLNSLVHRLVIGTRPTPMRKFRLADAQLDEIWDRMVHDVQSLGAMRLEARLEDDASGEFRKEWKHQGPAMPKSNDQWTLSLGVQSAEGKQWVLAVGGMQTSYPKDWHLLQLVDVLQRYSRHWRRLTPSPASDSPGNATIPASLAAEASNGAPQGDAPSPGLTAVDDRKAA